MSTRRGEQNRARPQKHQNSHVWKFDKFKTDPKTKVVNEILVTHCCTRCTGVIEWKIKYGKYKPLTQPGKCNNCHEKRVKSAYQAICVPCVRTLGVCAKCCQKEEFVNTQDQNRLLDTDLFQSEIRKEISDLPERKRRSVLRLVEKREYDLQRQTKERARIAREKLPVPEGWSTPLPTLPQIRKELLTQAKEWSDKFGKGVGLEDLDEFDDEF